MKQKIRIIIAATVFTLNGLPTVFADQPLHWNLPPQTRADRLHRHHPHPPVPSPMVRGKFGDPLPGLTTVELGLFALGKEEFESAEEADEGLGPIFNNNSCAACHTTPVVGGASTNLVTRFGRMGRMAFDPLTEKGGSLLQAFAIDPAAQEVIPPDANVVAHRVTTPLFGLGLVEAIPDRAIRQLAAQPKPSGVTGRVSEVTDVTTGQARVGRFGWKAQHATLLAFASDAYLNEMGITSRFFPTENAPNGDTNLLAIFDGFADPEDEVDPATGKSDIDASTDFMRFAGAPPRLPMTFAATVGLVVFQQINCTVCHNPTFQTGTNVIAALDRKTVNLFSDLLLHDMGALGDGIAQGTATTREMRTAPLWGLRGRPVYLHDGRAKTVDAAIRAHDGEAVRSRDNYNRLSPAQRACLVEFLNSI